MDSGGGVLSRRVSGERRDSVVEKGKRNFLIFYFSFFFIVIVLIFKRRSFRGIQGKIFGRYICFLFLFFVLGLKVSKEFKITDI